MGFERSHTVTMDKLNKGLYCNIMKDTISSVNHRHVYSSVLRDTMIPWQQDYETKTCTDNKITNSFPENKQRYITYYYFLMLYHLCDAFT